MYLARVNASQSRIPQQAHSLEMQAMPFFDVNLCGSRRFVMKIDERGSIIDDVCEHGVHSPFSTAGVAQILL